MTYQEFFTNLKRLLKEAGAVIYSDNDGNVWVCIGNDHYRATMITGVEAVSLESVKFTKIEDLI